jgi:hypothetical protein
MEKLLCDAGANHALRARHVPHASSCTAVVIVHVVSSRPWQKDRKAHTSTHRARLGVAAWGILHPWNVVAS